MKVIDKILSSGARVFLAMFFYVLPLIFGIVGGFLKDEFGMVALGNKFQIVGCINVLITHVLLPFVMFIFAIFTISKSDKPFIVK